jgi:tetratricopeptide (TPR) repeat protein
MASTSKHTTHQPIINHGFCQDYDNQSGIVATSMRLTVALTLTAVLLIALPASAQNSLTLNRSEQVYAKATELMDLGNYGAARDAFEDFLLITDERDVRRAEAEYSVASAALQLKNKDGEALMQQFVTEWPTHPRNATAQLELAQSFYNAQKYSKAITWFSKTDFSALPYDKQMEGKFQYAYSYFSERKLTDALVYFNQVKLGSHPYAAAANYYAGFVEYSEAKYDEALTDLKRAEANESYSTIVPYLIASVYYRKGQYDELLSYVAAKKDNEAIKNRKDMLLLMAEALYAKGDFSRAAGIYNESLNDKTATDPGIWYRAGLSNYKAGNLKEAVRLLELSAAANDEVSPVASYQLGIVYLQQNEKLYALNAFDRARKATDKDVAEQAQFNFAKVAYDQGQSDKAIAEFEKYLITYPQGSFANETKELLAQAYVNGNNYNKAIDYIEALPRKSAAIEQAYQKATFLKGSEFFNRDNLVEAIAYFTKSLQYPRDEKYVQRASFWCAEALTIQKKYAEAEPLYQRSVQGGAADPTLLPQAYYGLGFVHYNTKQFDKALISFKEFTSRAPAQSPNYNEGLLRLADCYYIQKRFTEALSVYNQYKQKGSGDMDYAYLQTGLIYGLQRDYQQARTQLSLLINSFPSSSYRAEAIYQRGQFDIEQGNYQNAVDGLSQLIQSEPSSAYVPYAYARRAASYFNLKNYQQTVSDYSTLIKLYPAHPLAQEVLLPLQEALELAGKGGEFDQYLAAVKNANPDNKGLESLEFETAKKLYFSEQYQKAITSLQGFVKAYPQSAFVTEANYYQAESYYRLRDYEKALPVYQALKGQTTFTYAPRVVARLADLTFRTGRYQDAVINYHQVEKNAVTKKDLYNALSGLMESFYLLAQYDSSDFYAKQILERAAINTSAENKASLYLGKSAMARGDYESAEDEFLNTLNTARDEYGAEAKYQLATIFHLRKDYKQCYETLVSLNDNFASYESWVGKSYLLLSDNFLAQNDVFQAKATLQSLVENFPLQSIKNEAAVKLKAIEQKQAAEAADTTANDN